MSVRFVPLEQPLTEPEWHPQAAELIEPSPWRTRGLLALTTLNLLALVAVAYTLATLSQRCL